MSFVPAENGNNTGALTQQQMLSASYDFEGKINLTGTTSPSISARTMLNAGAWSYWLQGPVVTSVMIEDRANRGYDVNTDGGSGNPLHPIFEARFYPTCSTASGVCTQLGFTLENSWASSTLADSAREQTFSMTLQTGNSSPTTQLTQASFTHLIDTRWRRAFWIDWLRAQ